MSEAKEIDLMLSGIIPSDFSTLEEYRVNGKYSLHDLAFNMNDAPYKSDTAIIVTSYAGQLGWLKATLTSYRKTGHYVILAYDNTSYIWNNLDDSEYMLKMFPRPIHYLLAHSVVFKHKTFDADKRTGWYWDVQYARHIVNGFKNFKYVYITNGDCIVERPEGFQELKEILGDGDFMSGQSMPGKTIHTADIILKVEAFNKIMDYMETRMKFPIMASQSPEMLLRDAVDTLKLKETFAPEQPLDSDGNLDYYCKEDKPSTFQKVIGFKNIYHSFEYRENYGLDPIDKKYLDPFMDYFYFRNDWRETV